jgi:cobalt-zinc-cadmium efflux system membrane fusion protein
MARRPAWELPPRIQIFVALAIVGVGLLVVLIVMALRHASGPAASSAALGPSPVPVPSGFFKPTDQEWQSFQIARVDAIPFPTVDESDGTIVSADDATTQVFSAFTGRVTAVYVTVGDTVSKGTRLFAVEGSEYAQAQNDLAAAVETLRSARVQEQVTASNRKRLLALKIFEGAATKDVEQSAADLAAAQTAVRNGETAVALVRSRLRVLGLSDAAIDRLPKGGHRAALPSGVFVTAPIGGIVTQRAVGVGQNVLSAAGGSTDALFTITDLSHVFFVANIPETAIARVDVGDPETVRMLAFPGRTFDARVRYIAPTVDPATHRIFVRSEVENSDGSLKPGMFGNMTIATGPALRRVGVPEQAVIFEGDTARVWITGPGKTLALRYLKVGPTVDGMVEVSAGLRPGDHVVTSGSLFIDRALRGGD